MAKRTAQVPNPASETLVQTTPEAAVENQGPNPEAQAAQAAPVANVAVKSSQVVIDKADLDKLFSTITDQGKQIDLLFQVADKGRLARVVGSGEGLIKTVKIGKYNGQYVVGWQLTTNQSEIINGRWIENQVTTLILEDKSRVDISLLDFYRKITKDVAEIVKRSTIDEDGKTVRILHVRFKDGKELHIDDSFIN